jgi:hypothetical protein
MFTRSERGYGMGIWMFFVLRIILLFGKIHNAKLSDVSHDALVFLNLFLDYK